MDANGRYHQNCTKTPGGGHCIQQGARQFEQHIVVRIDLYRAAKTNSIRTCGKSAIWTAHALVNRQDRLHSEKTHSTSQWYSICVPRWLTKEMLHVSHRCLTIHITTYIAVHMKSSSHSRTDFFGASTSSSSASCSCAANSVSYDRAAFSYSRAFASSAPAFFCSQTCQTYNAHDKRRTLYLLRCVCSTHRALDLDAVNTLLLVIHLALDLRLVETVDYRVFAFRDVD